MTLPRILIAPHVRDLDTALGLLHVSMVYDQFFEKLAAAGGQPLTAWPGTPSVDDLLEAADGVLLIGGGDVDPERFGLSATAADVDRPRDEFEVRLALAARARGKPLLAVCRGVQLLNVALGGTLRRVEGHRQATDLTQATHAVEILPGTRLAAAVGGPRLEVNSFHNWAVDALGDGLRVVAESDGVVEGIEPEGDWWSLGVQWHLELLGDASSQLVFDELVAATTRQAP